MHGQRWLGPLGTGASEIVGNSVGWCLAHGEQGNRRVPYLTGSKAVAVLRRNAGQLEVVKAFVAAQPGVQRIRGPHSITLLAHAKAGGAMARNVYEFLQQLGDADEDPPPSLSGQEIESIVGTYTFGVAASQQVDVAFEQGKLTWTRKGVMGRWLVHMGDRAFYPVGAPSVRIRFAEDDGTVVMTIHDPDIVLIARRRKTAK